MRIPILCYHWFNDAEQPGQSVAPEFGISSAKFSKQMRYLAENGYTSISVDDLINYLERDSKLPPRPVLITFDDGYEDFYRYAYPALRENNLKATVFLITDYINGSNLWDQAAGEPPRPILSWSQIREMSDNGIEFGSHTCSHPSLDLQKAETIRRELEDSKKALEDGLGRRVDSIAYPYGNFNRMVKQIAAESGYREAFAVIRAESDLFDSRRYQLRRAFVHGDETMLAFRLRLTVAALRHQKYACPGSAGISAC